MHGSHPGGGGDGPRSRPEQGPSSLADDFIRWRDGDAGAVESLVRRFSPVLWHVARAYGIDAAAAEDAVQLTWMAMVRHADGIRDPLALPGWLTTVTRREAARLAQARPRETTGLDPATTPEVADPHRLPPEDVVVASLEAEALWQHVRRLPERCQRLLRVVAFAHRPDYTSLAVELGMPIGGIGPTRRRCLDKLRALLVADPAWSDR